MRTYTPVAMRAWQEERAFILARMAQGTVSGHRTWQREDLHDQAVVSGRRAEESIPLEEAERRLKEDGLL